MPLQLIIVILFLLIFLLVGEKETINEDYATLAANTYIYRRLSNPKIKTSRSITITLN